MAAPAAADRTAELQAHPNAPGVRPPDPGICPTTVHNVKDDRVAPLLPPAAITHCWLVDQRRCVLRRPAAATPSTGARIGPPPHRAGPRDRRPRQCSRLLPTAACPALMCPYSTKGALPRPRALFRLPRRTSFAALCHAKPGPRLGSPRRTRGEPGHPCLS